MIDVLKVDRRGDQTGVMMRGWIRETWLSKTTEKKKKGDKVTMDPIVTCDISDNMHTEKNTVVAYISTKSLM